MQLEKLLVEYIPAMLHLLDNGKQKETSNREDEEETEMI